MYFDDCTYETLFAGKFKDSKKAKVTENPQNAGNNQNAIAKTKES